MFLLNYIGDVGMCKATHAENIRYEQRKVIKYSHLVAKVIALHNEGE